VRVIDQIAQREPRLSPIDSPHEGHKFKCYPSLEFGVG